MLSVGQIIYIYKEKSEAVFPCVIAEELVKKTLKGSEVFYTVLLPDGDGTLVELDKLNAQFFISIDEFKSFYMKNVNDKLSKIIKSCDQIESNKFAEFRTSNVEKKSEDKSNNKSDYIVINDENNVKLNIDMSSLKKVGGV